MFHFLRYTTLGFQSDVSAFIDIAVKSPHFCREQVYSIEQNLPDKDLTIEKES